MQNFARRARQTLIGDKAFYKAVLAIIIPVIIQNGISNFVNLLDNLMVGALGNEEMSGVAIANQLVFVFNLCVFGGLSGAGIFGAQFYGAGDIEGLRNTFRIKLMQSAALLAVTFIVLLGFSRPLISLFLRGDGDAAMAEKMLGFGHEYLMVILVGLPAFAISTSYAGTLREMGETRLPMIASVSAVATNAVFNYLLIFGRLGFPRMGVVGAAVATVLSRYVELAIIVITTHRRKERYTFIQGAYSTFRVPGPLFKAVIKMGSPLLFNEALWSIGMSTLTAIYSLCGLTVVSALSINSTISNLFNVVFMSMGTAVSVMVGQALGADDYDRARSTAWKLAAFGVAGAIAMALLLILASPYIPHAYRGITRDVRDMATDLLMIAALAMPIHSFSHTSYFTLRSGGKTFITFLFDCVYTWVVSVPAAYLMVRVLHADIYASYATVEFINIVKCVIGFILVRKGVWIQNITRLHQHADA